MVDAIFFFGGLFMGMVFEYLIMKGKVDDDGEWYF